MVQMFAVVVTMAVVCAVMCKPLDNTQNKDDRRIHRLWKRFINTALTSGTFGDNSFSRLRTKRSEEEDCEKLELCKLHARSSGNFLAAFELYFVNKENAHLWDHQSHTAADCERRFSGCSEESAPAPAPAPAKVSKTRTYVEDDDYDY